ANGKLREGAPRVAIGFFRASYDSGETALIDAVIAEIERQGAEAVPVFGYPGAVAFERLLGTGEAVRADVGLGLFFQFNDAQSAKVLERVGIPVINLVSLYGRSEEEWRSSTSGLSSFEGTFNLASPELAGTIAPTVVGTKEKVRDPATGLTSVITSPIAERVDMAVSRALRYAELSRKANADKKIALMYYNYPPGKASIGASYLNVAESLANVLVRLRDEGYDVGDGDLSADAVLAAISAGGRNVGSYAPGELQAMLETGEAVRVPVARYGNVVLWPQPVRGWGEDQEKLYHAKDLAPHHQYVAAYAWLRHGFGADAVVHVGTHGTLEWLDGKDVGLTEEDASDALLGDLPDIYIYNVDVVGEGLVARRRGLATLVDHMVPPFVQGGLYAELAALSESIDDYDSNLHKNPELSAAFADQVREQVMALGIAKDLGLDLAAPGSLDHDTVHRLQAHMLELRSQNIPYGLHAFGRVPSPEARASTVEAIAATDRSRRPVDAKLLAEDMDARIVESGARELGSLVRALAGGFVPVGSGNEPIRNPDAYPTGKNFYGIDPEKVPKRAAWELGVRR